MIVAVGSGEKWPSDGKLELAVCCVQCVPCRPDNADHLSPLIGFEDLAVVYRVWDVRGKAIRARGQPDGVGYRCCVPFARNDRFSCVPYGACLGALAVAR